MRQVGILLGMLCTAAAAVCQAAPVNPPAAQPPSGAVSAKPIPENALRLARLANPEGKLLEVGLKGFDVGIQAELKRDPDAASVYTKNPGLLDAIVQAGRPVMRDHLTAVIPGFQRRFAQFYAEKFSPEEIDQLIAFYSSPTGTKVINAMYSGVDLEKLAPAATADTGLTAKDVAEFNRSAAAQLPDKFDAEDWKALFIFAATPAHAKLLQVTPEFNQLVAEVENQSDATLDKDMAKAAEGAVAAYMAKRKEKPPAQ